MGRAAPPAPFSPLPLPELPPSRRRGEWTTNPTGQELSRTLPRPSRQRTPLDAPSVNSRTPRILWPSRRPPPLRSPPGPRSGHRRPGAQIRARGERQLPMDDPLQRRNHRNGHAIVGPIGERGGDVSARLSRPHADPELGPPPIVQRARSAAACAASTTAKNAALGSPCRSNSRG